LSIEDVLGLGVCFELGRRFTLKEEWYFFDRLITTPSQFLPATTKLAVAPDQHLAHLDSVKQAL
jgi:hypothetical protein